MPGLDGFVASPRRDRQPRTRPRTILRSSARQPSLVVLPWGRPGRGMHGPPWTLVLGGRCALPVEGGGVTLAV